ncbi:hypothetical protein ACGF7U_07810 [Micromonospora sp. NPDC047670]|uniref:hypothetical protein n=1 Tax=Micromonospora sp. NPDC047670 TaxID=3364252 RepID=UPI003719F09E
MSEIEEGRVLRTRWTPGPAVDATGAVLVAVTAFRADRARDLPGIYRAGMRLRDAWPDLTGAVGMWLWTTPLSRRCGSVSVWRDQDALRQFVAWPDHVVIMKRYRRRGRLTSTTWTTERCEPSVIWREARQHLAER